MSERQASPGEGAESISRLSGDTPGAMLRLARMSQGLDLDTLASALKVPRRKLELLEQDQYAELPGMAFVRSLTLSVCRHLQIDAQQVLALLPSATAVPQEGLEHINRGLATPFREPGGRSRLDGLPDLLRPAVIVPVLLLLLALGFWLAPAGRDLFGAVSWTPAASGVEVVVPPEPPASTVTVEPVPIPGLSPAASAPASAPSVSVAPAATVIETVHSAPAEEPSASPPQGPAAAGALVLRPGAEAWVEVRDATGTVLVSRLLPAGEVVGLDGVPPLKLKIGNAEAMRLSYRGQSIDLTPFTRDSVARLELR